tara:strand:- start:103 stop:2145 length:2043 start_codon:yes stop_codon:yes gene_type:complete
MSDYEYLLSDINSLNGIGNKTSKLFKKKNINTIFDLLWSRPERFIDRTKITKLNQLQIGKIQTVIVNVKKYNFPRKRNLPNRVVCEDETGGLDCVFFNSYEGYIKKILPIGSLVTISGKIGFYKNKYQITNPTHVSSDKNAVKKIHSKYSLTEGLTEKKYNKIITEVLKKVPDLKEWHEKNICKIFDNISWKESVLELHKPQNIKKGGNFLKRLIFDEIFATLLINSKVRSNINKIKKIEKNFNEKECIDNIINKIGFQLTNDQVKAINEINKDLKSNKKMFRLLQGDVGSGKTIVSLVTSINVINSGYQVSFMAPTEILARQHFSLAKKIFKNDINIKLLTGKTEYKIKKTIVEDLKNNKIQMLIGTHSLFQEKIIYSNLGLVIIDEQHKFGVKQRKNLSDKGGKSCDVLVMSATPIPRTMIMTVFGDMDVSIIKEKPKNRKDIKTYSKVENNINDVIKFVKKEVGKNNQVFWVCPLIEESKKVDHQSSIERYKYLKNFFSNDVGLLHGSLSKEEKNEILNNFLNKKIKILVSTTVIEVGIDFPNANLIIIENANKFGLSQLHQLRGRVGRGNKESSCILIFKSTLSENAKKRIKILKSTNDGFKISEEDMKLRGYGDLLGFKQSGMPNFRLADPVLNEDLFLVAEKEIKRIKSESENFSKYMQLLKLYDRADILSDLV